MPKGKPKLKTAIVTLRVEPQVKAVAELAAKQELRSVTSLVEVLLLKHGESLGIKLPQSSKQEPES